MIRSLGSSHTVCFLNERPEPIHLDPAGVEILEGGRCQEIRLLTGQPVVPGDCGLMVAGHPADAAHRDLLQRMPADQFNLAPIQMQVIEGSVFRLNEVGPAVFLPFLTISFPCSIRKK